MQQGTARKIAIVVLGILTLGLGITAVVIGLDVFNNGQGNNNTSSSSSSRSSVLSTSRASSDVSVDAVCCGGGTCGNGTAFGPDYNYGGGTCAQREEAIRTGFCADKGGYNGNGSDPIACPTNSNTSAGTTNSNSPNCMPAVSGSSVFVPGGCNNYETFAGTRRMTGPEDQCFVDAASQGNRNGPFTLTAQASACYCQQVDVKWNGQIYGARAKGAWNASCTGGSSNTTQNTTTTTTTTTTSSSPEINVVKSSQLLSCSVDGSNTVNYTVRVTNTTNTVQQVNTVVDTLETGITSSMISNISNSGSANANVITWTGPFSIPANSTITFTYSVTVTTAQRQALGGNIQNMVVVTYGSNSRSFTLLTNLTCLPSTGLFDEEGRPLLIGLILILIGLLVNRSPYILNWAGSLSTGKKEKYLDVAQLKRPAKHSKDNRRFESELLDDVEERKR
jgi:hypothetical protein